MDRVPTISWFYGISIRMYFGDHAPPHFHAYEPGNEAQVRIADGEIIKGRLSRSARGLVKEWTLINQAALMENWERSRPGLRNPLQRIPGLDTPR
ncbi:DUF4160 domain-containing protein [Brevundimonas sp.]|uniref:DUF4160 domain-containing protein n=1 Tax=Brevundimonas sp. TaxID=1871086 RepID=UPI0039C86492